MTDTESLDQIYAQHEQVRALARSMIVLAALKHGSTEEINLPLDPAALRMLGRAMEAMLAFREYTRAVDAAHAKAREALDAEAANVQQVLDRARGKVRKARRLAYASLALCLIALVAVVLA